MMPTIGQILTLLTGCLAFAVGGGISLARLWTDHPGQRLMAKICFYLGIGLTVVVLVWHAGSRGAWLPLEDNFETLLWVGLLLAVFLMYTQRRKPIGGLDWFIMPIVIVTLVTAAVFGRAMPRDYGHYVQRGWIWLHLVGTFGGALA